MWQLCNSKQYFNELYNFDDFPQHALIDGGAFTGDTDEAFLNFVANESKTKVVYSFEPDKNNYLQLASFANSHKNVYTYDCALGEKRCEKYLVDDENVGTFYEASISSMSKITQKATDNKIKVVAADEVIGNKPVSFVKLDLEGGEMDAPNGMKRIITEQMPFLAICVYHKTDDLITIPTFIRNIAEKFKNKKYVYYLRHHDIQPHETVFYAVPT